MQTNTPHLKPYRTAYQPIERVQLVCGPSRTKQSFKDECDINQIMKRYQATGVLDFVQRHEAQYADVVGIDFDACLAQIKQAQDLFQDLPSTLRERFHNNPGRFIDFVADPANKPEMRALGLLTPISDSEKTDSGKA